MDPMEESIEELKSAEMMVRRACQYVCEHAESLPPEDRQMFIEVLQDSASGIHHSTRLLERTMRG